MTSTYETDILIREKIAESLEVEIDDYCESIVDADNRTRLGSSQIGKSCSREIWYGFRWAKKPVLGTATRPAGRVARLFNRGHREEPALIKYLEAIGCKFIAPPDGRDQHPFSSCEEHAGTEVDGIGYLPPKFGVDEKVLFEFKTANMNYFNRMKKHGIQNEQPKYWAQVNFAGLLAGLKYVCFVVVSKNDDDIHIEFHKLDPDYGEMLIDKAMHIISAVEPPTKIALSVTNFACKFCNFKDICHHDEPVEKNCRSCKHATPAAGGKWACCNPAFENGATGMEIPADVIPLGCPHHEGVD
jgi:hypothetical protein